MGKINISINLTFKNIMKVLAITALIFTILISILYFQEYEISELTPSIISSDLQENSKENIFNYKTTIFLEKSKLGVIFYENNAYRIKEINFDKRSKEIVILFNLSREFLTEKEPVQKMGNVELDIKFN